MTLWNVSPESKICCSYSSLSPYQLLLSVDSNRCSYQLTVIDALQRPSLFGSRSSLSGGVHNDSTLGQLFWNLNACCLVVYTHLLFNKSFRICWKLCRPSWSRAVFSGSSFLYFADDPVDFRVSRHSIFVREKILLYGDKQFFFSYVK